MPHKSAGLYIRLSPDEKARWSTYCKQRGISASNLLRSLMEAEMNPETAKHVPNNQTVATAARQQPKIDNKLFDLNKFKGADPK